MDDLHSLAATIALVAGLAWASGLRLYLTLFAVGLLSHFQLVALPPALGRNRLSFVSNPRITGKGV